MARNVDQATIAEDDKAVTCCRFLNRQIRFGIGSSFQSHGLKYPATIGRVFGDCHNGLVE
jgi:hypothetical protein